MVAGVFRKLREAARGSDGRAKAQGYLQPIDTDEIAREFDLAAKGRERGAQELPSSETLTPDGVEQQVTELLEAEWSWHGSELINNLRAYAGRLVAVSVQTELANLRLKAQNTLTKLRNANHRAEAELGPLRETYVAYRDELKKFQADNHLKRSARSPAGRWTTAGLLVLLVAFESLLNGFFFAKGADLGLIGGIGTAMGISLVNVILSFAIGLFPLRWINHCSYLIKFIGVVVSISAAVAVVALHGFAAHYRDATALIGEYQAFQRTLDSLRSNPIALTDLNSYYLFGLGLVLAATSIWKGYTFDDPYPRYGASYRRATDARETYSDEHAFLFENLEEIKEQTILELDDGIRRIPRFPQEAVQIRAQRDAHLQSFKAYESNIESATNRLLAIYRDANLSSRRTPQPRYFDTSWRLRRSFLTDTRVLAELAEPAATTLDANAALDELRELATSVLTEYEVLLNKYPHPTQML